MDSREINDVLDSDMDNSISSVAKGKIQTNTIGVRKKIDKKRNVGKPPIPHSSGGVADDSVTSKQKATYPIPEPKTLVLEVHAQKEDNCVQNEELYEAIQNGEFDIYLVLFIF
ncbi:hypothetical protein ACOSQ4_019929 [Xanthoceras sorbifolium]